MPWTGKEFASRHNHKLKGVSADHAARQANAMLRAGVPEGEAIATANKHANVEKGKTKVARLTSKERAKLPASDFAGPGRSYPIQDKAHARAAKGFAAMHHAPNKAAIDRKADQVLGKGSKMKPTDGREEGRHGSIGPKGRPAGDRSSPDGGRAGMRGHFEVSRGKMARTEASSNAKAGGMRHGTTHATGKMASRFDTMSKKSGSTKY